MMSKYDQLISMVHRVAEALGEKLRKEAVFVGGCTTALLIPDEITKDAVRYTDDVDVIVDILTQHKWHKFQNELERRGFKISMDSDMTCRMCLENLKVDFMPTDENILGFSNRWYKQAINTAKPYTLSINDASIDILLISPPYFIATKLEAYNGRGNNDPIESHDMEDILTVIDGRPALVEEIEAESDELRKYISEKIIKLYKNSMFDHAIQSAAGVKGRERIIHNRLTRLINYNTIIH